MTSLIGQTIGRYQVVEQLGEGGMAVVYKAYDASLDRYVAVKVIRSEAFPAQHHARIFKRFEREAKALSRLSQPNIVTVIEYGEHEGVPYLVMEYIPGGTLKQRLEKQFPWQEAFGLLLPIAQALEFAHNQGIIHRDVKPSNILLTESDELKLTDFGIAKLLESGDVETLSTTTGVGVGTPEYMAPEQGLGQEVDARADIYSLGVVLYELITGKKPFRADTPMAVVVKHINDPLPRPQQFVRNLPDAVEKVLFKALAKKPGDRYRTMTEFGNALKLLLEGTQNRERKSTEKAQRKKIKHDVLERSRREREEQHANLRLTLSNRYISLKSRVSWTIPFLRVLALIGIVVGLIWITFPLILNTDFLGATSNANIMPITFTPLMPTQRIIPAATTSLTHVPTQTQTILPTATQTPILLAGTVQPVSTLSNNIVVLDSGEGSQIVLVYVPPGTVSVSGNGMPTHDSGSASGFYMSIYEVTWGQIQTFLNDETIPDDINDRVFPDVDWPDSFAVATGRSGEYFRSTNPVEVKSQYRDYPVISLSYYGASNFAAWVSERSGYKVRLPTAAEWEYAASGGSSNRYPWGDLWDQRMLNTNSDYALHFVRVGLFPPNAFGLYDMCGNANEWTTDLYTGPNNYSSDWPNLVIYKLKGGGGRPEIGLGNPSTYCQIGYDDYEAANSVNTWGNGFRIVIDP